MSSLSKVAVITGASAGVGLAAAEALARAGWRVIGIGRDPGRTAAAEAQLRERVPGADITMLRADLALVAGAEAVAAEIAGLTDRVHLLANNAGGMAKEQVITAEGLEACFAGNHVGPFALTNALLPLLRRAAAESPAGTVRIVNTSSDGSEMIPGMNWDDIENSGNYTVGAAYCSGKLANVLFAKELARRLGDDGIMAFSFHPGTVGSNFITHVPASTRAYMETLDMITPEQGADTLVWLATQPAEALENGGYYYCRAPRAPNAEALDPAKGERLWRESEALVARARG